MTKGFRIYPVLDCQNFNIIITIFTYPFSTGKGINYKEMIKLLLVICLIFFFKSTYFINFKIYLNRAFYIVAMESRNP